MDMKKIFLALFSAVIGTVAFGQSIYTTYSECPEGAVDMGIVMTREDGTYYNIYWGTCNIGAETPEERGEFFAWGEIETKESYNWDNYAYGDINEMTKYVVPTGNSYIGPAIRLSLDDDVAHVRLQGRWRMPTMGEWLALQNQCDWQYEKLGELGGYRVTSRVNPENSIFLPIGGMIFGDVMYDYGGEPYGHYWSSSLCVNSPGSAWYFTFNKWILSPYQGAAYRYYGYNVRPVSE